jgi:hypothetical protein
MHIRSVLVAAMSAATLVVGAAAAHADNIVHDADTLTAGDQASLSFGSVACGAQSTRTVDVWVNKNGSGTNVYADGSTVDVTATTTAPLAASVPAGSAGDIAMPSNWSSVANNTDSAKVRVTVTVTPTTAGSGTGTIVLSGVGKNSGGSALTRSDTLSVSWTAGSCAPVKTATTTTLSCPTSVTYTGAAQEPCTATTTGTGGFTGTPTITYGPNTNAGTVSVTASYPGDATHEASSDATSFLIAKAASTTTLDCTNVTYTGGSLEPCAATVGGAGTVTGTPTVTYADNTEAGTATASATYAGDANHDGSSAEQKFTIGQAAATCTVAGYSGTYDGVAHGLTGSCTGLDGSVVGTLDLGATHTDAGSHSVQWSFEGGRNYADQSGSAVVTIARAPSSVELVCPASVVYDGSAQMPCSATVTGAGGLSETVPADYSSNVNAGTASASAIYTGGANHEPSEASTTFEISKAPSTTTLTCAPGPYTYTGSAIMPCTALATGAGGLNQTVTPTYQDNIDAGSAGVSATFNGDDNHDGSSDSRTFTIDRAPSTTSVTCDDGPFVYSGSAFTPCSASVTGAGGLDTTVDVTYMNNVDAGTAGAAASWSGDANHEGSMDSATFAIAKAPSAVSVSCPAGPYYYTGSPVTPACTASVDGAGGLHVEGLPVVFTNNTAVGKATASASYSGDANHTAAIGSASFEISAWTLDGFFKPVDMNGVVNTVKNGSTVPLKFRVFSGSTELTSTSAVKSFSVQAVSCSTSDPQDAIEELATTGGTSLRYDTTGGQFVQNWQTPKKAGTCYRATMTTQDGSAISAKFMLK